MQMLQDKVALITGATSGIGERTAELFVEEGAYVTFTGRRQKEGEVVARRLGNRAQYVQADATREADWQRIIAQLLERYGRLDVLFNNAGGPAPTGSIATIPVEEFDAAMALLVRSVMLGMKHAAPIMRRQQAGSIINNGSIAAHLAGYSSSMVYSAAKAAVVQLTRCAAMELGEDNIRVNSVSPGAIATGIVAKALGVKDATEADALAEKMQALYARVQPIPRSGMPDDIAQCVCWLASDRSRFINGEDVVVDGGLIGGRMWSAQQAGLQEIKKSLKADS